MKVDASKWDTIHRKIHKENDRHSKFAEEMEKLFPRGSIVCDLGGGTGGDVLHFLKQGHSVILLDLSEFALKVATDKAKKAGLAENLVVQQVHFGLHKLPLKNESIDVAYSRIALNYFGNKHTATILKNIYSALKVGGHAFLSFKSPKDEREMERLKQNAVLYEPGVYIEAGQLRSRFSVEQLEKIATLAGISQYKVEQYEESLGIHESGQHQVLYQNVLSFTKSSGTTIG